MLVISFISVVFVPLVVNNFVSCAMSFSNPDSLTLILRKKKKNHASYKNHIENSFTKLEVEPGLDMAIVGWPMSKSDTDLLSAHWSTRTDQTTTRNYVFPFLLILVAILIEQVFRIEYQHQMVQQLIIKRRVPTKCTDVGSSTAEM